MLLVLGSLQQISILLFHRKSLLTEDFEQVRNRRKRLGWDFHTSRVGDDLLWVLPELLVNVVVERGTS